MADKSLSMNNEQVHIPLEFAEDEISKLNDSSIPPPYEYPKIDFTDRWKDRKFAFMFWIYVVAVVVVGLVLGTPAIGSYVKRLDYHQDQTVFKMNISLLIYSVGGAVGTSGLMSIVIFFFFQICAGRMIAFSLIFSVIIQIIFCVLLAIFVHWGAAIVPGVILVLILIFAFAIRKRIKFAETHLRVGCAVLRSHPSLIVVAILVLILQIVWFIFWKLMVLGILNKIQGPSIEYDMNRNPTTFQNQTYGVNKTVGENNHLVANVATFVALLLWYWAAVTFTNLVHFISACAVGHWWFTSDADQQYSMRSSIKRSLTTNFGTICFGSLLEAIIKALRACLNEKKRSSIISCCAECILSLIERLIGYINEGAFIYSALTGQSFFKASQSFINLFKQRGWTMVLNDSIVGYCLAIINIAVGLTSAAVSSLIIYLFFPKSSEEMLAIIIGVSIIGFFVGVILNATMTTVLKSCVRTVFVCFALNPAALGATHPEHLQCLTDVWHEFYPNEFAASGYAAQYPKLFSENSV